MPAHNPAPTVHPVNTPQVVKSQPVRCDIRIGGRIVFAQDVYDPAFETADGAISFTADLEPTWIDPPPTPPPTRFADQLDPRDGDDVIMRVHSGRRDIVEEPQAGPEDDDEEPDDDDEDTAEDQEEQP